MNKENNKCIDCKYVDTACNFCNKICIPIHLALNVCDKFKRSKGSKSRIKQDKLKKKFNFRNTVND
jgi:hypothetical protein